MTYWHPSDAMTVHMGKVLPLCNARAHGWTARPCWPNRSLGFGVGLRRLDVLDRPFAAGGPAGRALEGGRGRAAQMGREARQISSFFTKGAPVGREGALHGWSRDCPRRPGCRVPADRGRRARAALARRQSSSSRSARRVTPLFGAMAPVDFGSSSSRADKPKGQAAGARRQGDQADRQHFHGFAQRSASDL